MLLALHPNRDAIEVVDAAFRQDAVVLPAALIGRAAHHQARLIGRDLPAPVGVGDAHKQHAAVSVDILLAQAIDGLLVVRIGTRAGSDDLGHVGQRPLSAVGVDAWADVVGPRVEDICDGRLQAKACRQLLDEVEAGAGRRDLAGVDVAVDPQRRFLRGRAGGEIGHSCQPDVTPFVALADARYLDEVGIFGGVGVEKACQVFVAVVGIEANVRHWAGAPVGSDNEWSGAP